MQKILLASLSFILCISIGYAQTIALTFTAKDASTQNTVGLSSVRIENYTLGCDTTIFGTNPSLIVHVSVGLNEHNSKGTASLQVMPNRPNPFSGSTVLTIYLPKSGNLQLLLTDISGKILAKLKNEYEAGFHKFEVSSNVTGFLSLNAYNDKENRSIKLISTSDGTGNNSIRYIGIEKDNLKSSFAQTNNTFRFNPGDLLSYTASASGFMNSIIQDRPSSSKTYTFQMQAILLPSVSTSAITDPTPYSVTCGGNVTSDGGAEVTARGVCWSIGSLPDVDKSHTTDGGGTGKFVSNLTSLTPNTYYYVRAYATNSAGTAYGDILSFTTPSAEFICGNSFTVNHVAGAVAPVSKTVSYGTVTNIVGESLRCWLTSNLGADRQATAVNDATEASAGWYWQFVRKQGYKHDGTTRTPNTTWEMIGEWAEWTPDKDPCTIELGNGWRIPTNSEWSNADDGGGWWNIIGPWNSGLKLHLSGQLDYQDGSLSGRGNNAGFQSASTGSTTSHSWFFKIGTSYCNLATDYKSYGYTTRCIKDSPNPVLPTVSTNTEINISMPYAGSGGNVTSDGGVPVTARGVCWSTSSLPVITNSKTVDGSGTGFFFSTISGLAYNTTYFLRAYATNSAGTAYGNEISFKTPAWTCGYPIFVNHVAGAVAPVSKTVSYGTVSNIAGESLRCWLTSNLGADRQATAVNDATEASAGWYWQFGKKQGYKHDGTTRTPNTTWENMIGEWAEWTPDKDPCTIELGNGWRIPTSTEWNNVDVGGGWWNIFGPWDAGLKLHLSGQLNYQDGSLGERGSYGPYQSSSTAVSSFYSKYLNTGTGVCAIADNLMSYGNSVRCIKDSPNPVLPTVSTNTEINISTPYAGSGGNVTSDGGGIVTARGVCWSTSSLPVITNSKTVDGSGTGFFFSTVSGLAYNTTYFVRAYATNSAGTAYGNEISFKTTVFTCGYPIFVNHVAGTVAPVSKDVRYGTVTNITGESSRCWLTSNLGADRQATAVNDATEASAGWYWQFNLKQGYKHDGTTRIPNTAWVDSYSDWNEWTSQEDPCAIELGNGWRIPTGTEWSNVDQGGGWTSFSGPWNSGLKLHLSGQLDYLNGSLLERGTSGMYASSTKGWTAANIYLNVGTGYCNLENHDMSYGNSVRCIKDSPNPSPPIITTSKVQGISHTFASSGGNVTSDGGAIVTTRGVCWSTLPAPTISDRHTNDGGGIGYFYSAINDLTPNTLYYVRAYATNSGGTAYGNEFRFATLGWTCGSVIPINHEAGLVAPVSKTVTYGTIANITGESTRCWLTSNLGADRQATTVADATEASAGWYWQFGRKQGYKHDGATRTPNSAWIGMLADLSEWKSENDPCTIELGNGWRIPTSTEWNNVDVGGGWWNIFGPWDAGLKLHLSGQLNYQDGSIQGRGSYGPYQSSSSAVTSTNSKYLNTGTGFCAIADDFKSNGYPTRCIKDAPNPTLSTVTTDAATGTTQSYTFSGGNVTADGGGTVTARGVCWSIGSLPVITNNKTVDGSGTGIFSSVVSGLAYNTTYFVRAYATNSAGTAYGNEISFKTLAWSCGSPITINHVGGAVAPVTKTVTYGTVSNIPGETSKCWITSNLGADHQATSVSDATEASAGWYWQFGHKQGFKHDGSNRTPNTTWISPINETLNWQAANDPCALELGTGWRIPTSTEWTNIDASGSWTNWNSSWNSGLKLHAAGQLFNGQLIERGLAGFYWSNTQRNTADGFNLFLNSTMSVLSYSLQAGGFSLRCIKP